MEDERITRRVKPQAVVVMPLWLKQWLEETAKDRETSQSSIVVDALLREKVRIERERAIGDFTADAEGREAVPA